jgi:hypothetical protein
MTPLRRWVVRLLERALDRYSEGPNLPARFVSVAEQYRWTVATNRGAETSDWEAFAIGLAASAYRDGYVRGFEAAERWEHPWDRHPSPEDVADAERPGWRETPAFEPEPR